MTFTPPALAATPFDLGDAPVHFDQGQSRSGSGPNSGVLGLVPRSAPILADARTGFSIHASNAADADRGDDGVAARLPFPTGRLARFSTHSRRVRVDRTARLCGWVDFDLSGTFGRPERACTDVPAGSTSAELTWSGRPAAAGRSYAAAADRVGRGRGRRADRPSDGEIEDYRVRFVNRELAALPDLSLTKTVSPNQDESRSARN